MSDAGKEGEDKNKERIEGAAARNTIDAEVSVKDTSKDKV